MTTSSDLSGCESAFRAPLVKILRGDSVTCSVRWMTITERRSAHAPRALGATCVREVPACRKIVDRSNYVTLKGIRATAARKRQLRQAVVI